MLNITWLQDANYAKTSGYDADGQMDWATANAWAAGLSYNDSVRGVTYDDWRLPTMIDTGAPGCDFGLSGTDCGFNVQTYSAGTTYSEMAYMYHVNLGLKSQVSTAGDLQPDFGIFGNGTYNGTDEFSYSQNDVGLIDNLRGLAYWSAREYALDTDLAGNFYTAGGMQTFEYKSVEFSAWAVRDGDVAAWPAPSCVPEPTTVALLALGLLGLGLTRCRG